MSYHLVLLMLLQSFRDALFTFLVGKNAVMLFSINCFVNCQLSYKVSQMHLVNLMDSCVTG